MALFFLLVILSALLNECTERTFEHLTNDWFKRKAKLTKKIIYAFESMIKRNNEKMHKIVLNKPCKMETKRNEKKWNEMKRKRERKQQRKRKEKKWSKKRAMRVLYIKLDVEVQVIWFLFFAYHSTIVVDFFRLSISCLPYTFGTVCVYLVCAMRSHKYWENTILCINLETTTKHTISTFHLE